MMKVKRFSQRCSAVCLTILAVLSLTSCGKERRANLLTQDNRVQRTVNLFSPMEKTDPNAENVARTASDLTIAMAEERLGSLTSITSPAFTR